MMRTQPILNSIETSRRTTIATRENPRINRDYLISLKNIRPFNFAKDGESSDLEILIRYVPDRLICDSKLIGAYFDLLSDQAFSGLEEIANSIADDFGNELIPRWISVDLSLSVHGILHTAHVEDKQPLWKNTMLLHCPA